MCGNRCTSISMCVSKLCTARTCGKKVFILYSMREVETSLPLQSFSCEKGFIYFLRGCCVPVLRYCEGGFGGGFCRRRGFFHPSPPPPERMTHHNNVSGRNFMRRRGAGRKKRRGMFSRMGKHFFQTVVWGCFFFFIIIAQHSRTWIIGTDRDVAQFPQWLSVVDTNSAP